MSFAEIQEVSGVKEDSERLLGSFHDAAGGRLTAPVPLGDTGTSGGAARGAGFDPDSPECGVALRYLLNQGHLKVADPTGTYTLTVAGMDRVRESRGLEVGNFEQERSAMSDKTQKRLQTLLSIAIAMGLSQPVSNFIHEQIPERRGIRDDLTEAVLEGIVRMTAFFLASVVVRQLAGRR